MPTIHELEDRRDAILQEMRKMRSMTRGSVSEQYLKVPRKGKKKPVLRGPYYVWCRSRGGKTVSRRLTTPEQLQQARADIDAHKRFVALCTEFEELTERLGQMERETPSFEPEKKRRRSRSKQTAR